jgi:hypothetical protein
MVEVKLQTKMMSLMLMVLLKHAIWSTICGICCGSASVMMRVVPDSPPQLQNNETIKPTQNSNPPNYGKIQNQYK